MVADLEERGSHPAFEDSVIPTQPIDANNESAPPAQAALNDDGHADIQHAIAENRGTARVVLRCLCI